jgi:tetratricopeptide (TPR) repeat protein
MKYALLIFIALCSSACQKVVDEFEPNIVYFPNPVVVAALPTAFPSLSPAECRADWGKELRVGYSCAKEQDYYRAITAFKRALVFLPPTLRDRKMQIEYGIFHAYYLAYKYQDAIETYEGSSLIFAQQDSFPAYRDLLVQMWESYRKIGEDQKAENAMLLLQEYFPCDAAKLELSKAVIDADFPAVINAADAFPEHADLNALLDDYMHLAKSPAQARFYQTVLPGAGFYYVGQKKAAFTSFVINALFIWAAYRFFETGNIAAGIVTASLESGWYLGGINGAGLAATEFNERLYHTQGRDYLRQKALFPILMISTSF